MDPILWLAISGWLVAFALFLRLDFTLSAVTSAAVVLVLAWKGLQS